MKLLQLSLVLVCVSFSLQDAVKHQPEQGVFPFTLTAKRPVVFASKTLYNQSVITIKLGSTNKECKPVSIRWVAIGAHCKGIFSNVNMTKGIVNRCFQNPERCFTTYSGMYATNTTLVSCVATRSLNTAHGWVYFSPPSLSTAKIVATTKPSSRKRRENNLETAETSTLSSDNSTNNPANSKKQSKATKAHYVAITPSIAEYLVIVGIFGKNPGSELNFGITIEMEGPQGFLSAHEFPLLTFYEVMCVVYVFYAAAWLVMSAYNYHDLLRVQFWIGGVILLGLIEKAVHYSEYSTVDITGKSDTGTEKFAEVVSAFKRAVARMLVIIVSLGFGIVKPRLGPMLHRVVGIGILYFIVAVIEAMMRIDVYFDTMRKAWIFMFIPLAVVDSIICWWVFTSLLQTMKTLRLRRNTAKLSLYRHFANTILFCVLVSLGMMLWSIYYREQGCVVDFSNEWFETACWPILFSVILFVIMVLWRPNANNQRYAYSPMIDGDDSDGEDEEPMLGSGATETVKMRSTYKKSATRSDVDRTEEDLKWIEENIPQTVADAALPALMDSDEEVMVTKYEMNKME